MGPHTELSVFSDYDNSPEHYPLEVVTNLDDPQDPDDRAEYGQQHPPPESRLPSQLQNKDSPQVLQKLDQHARLAAAGG